MFDRYKATAVLKNLAKEPLDLTVDGIFNIDRIKKMKIQSLGFKYFYSSELLTDDTLQALKELAKESKAIEKMKKMQDGEIINKIDGYDSENRSVLHTAMRDFFEDRNLSKKAKQAADLAYQEVLKLKYFIKKCDSEDRFDTLVQIGIGGSDLGPRAVYLALKAYSKPNKSVYFVSNVDPDDMADVLRNINISKTLFVVVSKSGTTLETLTNESLAIAALKKHNLNPKDHIVAVTGKGSPMDDPNNYLASFYIWDYVGGRYSVSSMVGGVMLSFAIGFDNYFEFLKGANKMDKATLSSNIEDNIPLLSALIGIWNRNFLKLPTVAIIPYSQALVRFTAHLQQCDMESNGKRVSVEGKFVDFSTGPIIWGEAGTNSQHSFYQLIHQGTDVIPLEFIGFKESQYAKDLTVESTTSQEKLLSNLFAQIIALATGKNDDNPNKYFPGNRPSSLLLGKKLDAFTMGALLALYEHKIAFQGFIWGINSFDQEGVQLGKKLASKITQVFIDRNSNKETAYKLGQAYVGELDNFPFET